MAKSSTGLPSLKLQPLQVMICCLCCNIIVLSFNLMWSSYFFMLFSAPPVHVDGVIKDVVELVKDHPSGIPIRMLCLFFNQKYRRNLAVSEFGFKTVASFIDSLNDELLVEKEIIFHKNRRAVPTPVSLPRVNNDSPPANPTSPVVSFGAGFGQRGSEIIQEELMDKVKEVIKKYPAASHSIIELQNGYFLLFGSALPLDLYMSLYDNHTSKQLSSSCLVVNNKPAGAKCLESKWIYLIHYSMFLNLKKTTPYSLYSCSSTNEDCRGSKEGSAHASCGKWTSGPVQGRIPFASDSRFNRPTQGNP